jgi:hypothetical protein
MIHAVDAALQEREKSLYGVRVGVVTHVFTATVNVRVPARGGIQ